MALLGQAIKLTAEGFDIERRELLPAGAWIALLARDHRTKAFEQLRLYSGAKAGFMVRFDGYRRQNYVEIATADDLTDVILKTSNYAFNTKVFAVEDGDTFPPFGDRFTWMIYGSFVKD